MFQVEDVNCICIDWSGGSSTLYSQASNNIRVVGTEVAYFINILMEYGYSPSKVHLIGHSLGAHAAGETGRRRTGIGRITGLDPAGPLFEGTPPKVRLDPSDARFVDVIHSNAAHLPVVGFGMVNTTGHLDFYPNGGTIMPGCNDRRTPVEKRDHIHNFVFTGASNSCHHSRSHQFYFQSILHPKGFLAYPCSRYDFFQLGLCFPCPSEGCPMMGHYADQFPAKLEKIHQKYFLNTGADPPFTSWSHSISLKLSG
uniref:Triacylglycerol lipase n=1 Tax=Pelodiscus sinensis TaxID=13735 RepID=K7FB34_PELSI